jgi:hypothetical protein
LWELPTRLRYSGIGFLSKEGKRFFFEKKAPRPGKQKTFAPAGVGDSVAETLRTESFLVTFFQKSNCFSYQFTNKVCVCDDVAMDEPEPSEGSTTVNPVEEIVLIIKVNVSLELAEAIVAPPETVSAPSGA